MGRLDVAFGSKGEILAPSKYFPLCSRERTQVGHRWTSVWCHNRTSRLADERASALDPTACDPSPDRTISRCDTKPSACNLRIMPPRNRLLPDPWEASMAEPDPCEEPVCKA